MKKAIKTLVLFIFAMLYLYSSADCLADDEFYGTKNDFAKEAIYFVMTDRFVDGDKSNNNYDQGKRAGADTKTWDRKIFRDGKEANIGYLGGDFKGIIDNVDYIKDMGFTAIWITPIVDNPNEAFTGGTLEHHNDSGKTGYHGYWGVNFYKVDEHLESEGLTFKAFTKKLHDKKLKVVLDIVCNHGSPSYSMPLNQADHGAIAGYGRIYDKNAKLVADHKNQFPAELDHTDELQTFFNKFRVNYNENKLEPHILAQLSDLKKKEAISLYVIILSMHIFNGLIKEQTHLELTLFAGWIIHSGNILQNKYAFNTLISLCLEKTLILTPKKFPDINTLLTAE